MTTEDREAPAELDRLKENLAKVETLSQRLLQAMAQKSPVDTSLQAPSHELLMKAGTAYMADMVNKPGKILESQVALWGKSLKHFVEAQKALSSGQIKPPEDTGPDDPRFANPLWNSHPYFNFVKQQYLISCEAIHRTVENLDNIEAKDKRRLEYFSRQIIDMMAPTNFLSTNPDALERAVETEGQSLVAGLENLVHDIETNNGELMVTLSDKNAFKVGGNIGTSEGSVVYRNRLFELIQYKPTSEKVHNIPLVIFPPWINKFYILDLKEKNSMIKWIVDQGFTLFVVSWKNPDPSYRDVGIDTYVEEGYLTAISEIKKITGTDNINAVGYCIAGTTLSATLALMTKRRDRSIKSATFFTTLTDFSDQGEVGVFLDDDFVDGIEKEVTEKGILRSYFMSQTFSYLRSNDLIYRPAIRSYMLGETPPAFDLLYWNGDGTNLPARMAVEYLRQLCQEDRLARGEFELCGEKLSLSDVKIPLTAIACQTDHIAAWSSSMRGIDKFGSKDKTFILSESGHIAGIINPPTREKYGHYVSEAPLADPEDWLKTAEFTKGSWWPRWGAWLAKQSGRLVAARQPGDSGQRVLAPAPGTYVVETPEA